MRSLLAPFVVLLAVLPDLRAADPTFQRVWPQWHDADSFQSYYEDYTGKELVPRHWTVLRSQPAQRGGLYFLTRVENPGGELKGGAFVVRIIAPDSTDTRVYTFPADVPKGSRLFEIGLTGKDWAGPHSLPVAWDVELQAADGRVLVQRSSFLWTRPDR
jgi:hypothetical protein